MRNKYLNFNIFGYNFKNDERSFILVSSSYSRKTTFYTYCTTDFHTMYCPTQVANSFLATITFYFCLKMIIICGDDSVSVMAFAGKLAMNPSFLELLLRGVVIRYRAEEN